MEVPAMAGSPAPIVSGYDVGRCLGVGGSATVWLVTEQSTRRDFALKCFDTGAGTAPEGAEAEAAIRREVRILSALEHDHLVRAHAVVRLRRPHEAGEGGLGLALDYAPGGSLAALVAGRGRLGTGETVTVLTPIAQALAYLHGQGFTHGDVAPGNVLFTASGKPLLADLGVARMVADAISTVEVGTDGFRDPAPADAVRAGLQPERDVYSLAALGWYCLTGLAPEPGAQRPPLRLLVPEVPAALVAALEAGLNEDRRQRPSAADLAAAVYRSSTAEPVDLSTTVHPTVIPQLLTRRALQPGPRRRRPGKLRRHWRGLAPAGGFLRRKRRGSVSEQSWRSRSGKPGPWRRPGAAGAAGAHRGFRRAPARRAVSLSLAALVLLAGTWLLAGGAPARDAVAGLFPALGADYGAGPGSEVPAEPTGAAGTTAESSPGPADETPTAGGGENAVLPDLEALLASADPAEAVRGLARLRSLAFTSGDFGLLDAVNVPASAAAAADERIRTQLSGAGHVLAGFSTTLTRIETAADSTLDRAVVAITTESSGYKELDGGGNVVGEVPAAAAQQLELVLVPVDGRWRIAEILPGDPDAG